MLGILRFFLAFAVVFSHTGLTPSFHFGVMAVMVFYLIAGYVMTFSFEQNFGGSLKNIRRFYVDRFFRIYPLYLVSLALIVTFLTVTGYGIMHVDLKSNIINLTVFWLNVHPTIMNPPAWSLASESQFYLLLPFLIVWPRLKYTLILPSYAIFVAASLGWIHATNWGYKFLPGTLFLFILGSVLFDMKSDKTRRANKTIAIITALAVVHLAALSFSPGLIDQPYAFEVLAGLLGGGLWLYVLGDVTPAHKGLDNWLGKLSYPLFLSHVCVLYFFDYLRLSGAFAPNPRGRAVLQILVSVGLSLPLALIDDRVQAFRKRIQTAPGLRLNLLAK
jgi:peptidoglycan/LPS O-acetylase OafA/YrhL